MHLKALLSAAAVACIAGSGQALTIQEATFGEYSDTNDPTAVTDSIGTLDFGLNSVSGRITTDCSLQGGLFECDMGPDRGDAFLMTIAAGEALLSVNLTTFGTGPAGYRPTFAMVDAVSFNFVSNDVFAVFNSTSSIIDTVPIGAGTYVFAVGQGLADAAGRAEYDWELSFEVGAAPVIPLPAGLPLMLGALGAMAIVRRKRV